jgi:pyocin large subunit-like protein
MPTLLGEKDKHLGQNRTGKAVMLQHRRTNNKGDTSLRLSMMLESYVLSRTSRIRELSKRARSRDATSPR